MLRRRRWRSLWQKPRFLPQARWAGQEGRIQRFEQAIQRFKRGLPGFAEHAAPLSWRHMIPTPSLGEPGQSQPPIQFCGWAACRRDEAGPLGFVLIGATVDRPREVARLAFAAPAPLDLPEVLENVRIDRMSVRSYRLSSGSKEWVIEGVAHLHREVGKAFYQALPPQPVSWPKRFFWWLTLRVAANSWLQRWLFRRR